MQAPVTVPRGVSFAFWALAALCLGALALASLAGLDLLRRDAPSSGGGAASTAPRIAYFEFGPAADTLWAVDAAQPSRREKLLVAPHARDYGVIPSLAPDGRRFVYAALPPATLEPTPETPADLWLATLSGEKPRLIAQGIDLLVPAVWSPDGKSVVVRRSDAGAYELHAIAVGDGRDGLLVSAAAALFPIAFAPGGDKLFYVRLEANASDLYAIDLAGGDASRIARLADGLTRDWALSPAGDKLAYLVLNLSRDRIASRAFVLDLASGRMSVAGPEDADAFSPVWTTAGELALGTLSGEGGGALLRIGADRTDALAPPLRGFDVPLAFSSRAGFAVRSFEGGSASAPGRSVLTLLAGGRRITIASGEVTLLGWID